MPPPIPLAERIALDTAAKLERAASHRYETAKLLTSPPRHRLAALYLYGYSAEMWLAAAYFRSAGLGANDTIDRDIRHRRMVQARLLRLASGEPLMSSDPHPLVGWARFLEWQRSARGQLAGPEAQRLREAINKAIAIYKHWRPELRYKVVNVTAAQLDEVWKATTWLRDNQRQLWEA